MEHSDDTAVDDPAVDGNAFAGSLADIFTADVSTAEVTCAHCNTTNPVASEMAYVRGPGSVLRCSRCESVLARFAKTRDSIWLDLRGSTSWRIWATS